MNDNVAPKKLRRTITCVLPGNRGALMSAQVENLAELPVRTYGELLTADEYQEEMATRISEEIFQTEENAENVADVIGSFLQSYEGTNMNNRWKSG
jgi:hypothetical protein